MLEGPPIHQEQTSRVGLLPNSYWEGDKMKDGQVVGAVQALRTHFSAKAAALEIDFLAKEAEEQQEEPPLAILSGGYFRGPNHPAIGELMAASMRSYGTPPEAISREGDVYSTFGEVGEFLRQAKEKGLTNLVDIGFSSHKRRIKKLFKKFGHNFTFRSVEEIIKERGTHKFSRDYIKKTTNEDGTITEVPVHIDHEHNHYAHLLKRMGKSRQGLAYRFIYEPFAELYSNFVDWEKTEEKNRKARRESDPGYEFLVPIVNIPLPIDIYQLNGKRAESPVFTPFLKAHAAFKDIKAKLRPEPKKPRMPNMGRVEIFPVGPIRRTS